MVEVIATDEFAGWYEALPMPDAEAVAFSVELLATMGVALGHPHTSSIRGARAPRRELRVQSAGRPFRIFYAFDPRRQAVLLLGGDKTGDDRFYEAHLPRAERIWAEYLAEQASGFHDEEDRT